VTVGQTFQHVWAWWRGLHRRQQLLLAGTAAGTALLLAVFVHLFSTPEMRPLYTGLSPADSQQIARRLAARGVRFQISEDGSTISVPADRLDQLRMEFATEGPPASGHLGFELFDRVNWSGSDFSERVNYQRALEGELERTIETLGEVEAARVHLVLPHESLFTDQQRQGRAAVVVRLRSGHLSDAAIAGIARLVAGAVDDLPPENVTIVDAATGQPLQVRDSRAGPAGTSPLETELAEKIVATLAPVVGPDQVRASVRVERDASSGESTEESYDPNQSAVLSSEISEQTGTTAAAGGVAGTAGNVPRSAAPPAGAQPGSAAENIGMRTENKTFAVTKRIRHTIEPAGRIRRITAAVLVDDAVDRRTVNGHTEIARRKRTPAELRQIEELVKASIGYDAARGDQVVVENLSFVPQPVEAPAPPSLPDRLLRQLNRWMGVIRLVVLVGLFLLVYGLVIRPLQRHVAEALRARPQPATPTPQAAAAAVAASEPGLEQELETELARTNASVQQVLTLKRNLVEKVKHEPESASRLLEVWIQEKRAAS
jgi:flagellar M-ring protein FliF